MLAPSSLQELFLQNTRKETNCDTALCLPVGSNAPWYCSTAVLGLLFLRGVCCESRI